MKSKKHLSLSVIALVFFVNSLSAQNSLNKVKAKLTTTKKNKGEFVKEDNGEGITGPLHEKYMNRIVFARERVTRELPESKYDSVFTLGEPIYGRAYLQRGIGDYLIGAYGQNRNASPFTNTNQNEYTVAYVDDVPLLKEPVDKSDLARNNDYKYLTTFQILFFKNEEDGGNSKLLVDALNKLSDGVHKVRLETYAGTGMSTGSTKAPIAVGEFTLNKKGPAKLGRTFEKLEAGMTDATLEAKILKVTQTYGKKNGWSETFTKVKIKSEGWNIIRNSVSGIIVGRSIDAYVYAVWPDGHCTYQIFGFSQSHDGTKYMDNTYFQGVGDQEDCDCSK